MTWTAGLKRWGGRAGIAAILVGAVLVVRTHDAAWWWGRPHIVAVTFLATVVAVGWVVRGPATMHELINVMIAMASTWATWRVLALAATQTEDAWKGLAWPLVIASVCTAYATGASFIRTVNAYLSRTSVPVTAGVAVRAQAAQDENVAVSKQQPATGTESNPEMP